MKTFFFLCLFAFWSLTAWAGSKGDIYECTIPTLQAKIILKQASDAYYTDGAKEKCKHHRKIQFDWEAFSYAQLFIGKKSLSGVICTEDINFEFKSSNKYKGHPVSIWMERDRPHGPMTSINLQGTELDMTCELVVDGELD